jgi:hypothetical protein
MILLSFLDTETSLLMALGISGFAVFVNRIDRGRLEFALSAILAWLIFGVVIFSSVISILDVPIGLLNIGIGILLFGVIASLIAGFVKFGS